METDLKRTQMLELAKIFKVVVISMLKDIKENNDYWKDSKFERSNRS